MPAGMPDKCPKCGNSYLEREKNGGMDTGDWFCYKCESVGDIVRPPLTTPKKVSD